jgi:hypothetical protein
MHAALLTNGMMPSTPLTGFAGEAMLQGQARGFQPASFLPGGSRPPTICSNKVWSFSRHTMDSIGGHDMDAARKPALHERPTRQAMAAAPIL